MKQKEIPNFEVIITKRKNGSTRIQHKINSPSKTDQSYKNDCDVNAIMARFMKTGQVTHLAKGEAAYHDVTEVPDLDVALNTVAKAQEAFDALPSDIRKRFGNSPTELMKFISQEKNLDEARELGLISKNQIAPPSTLAGETRGSGTHQNNSNKNKPVNDDKQNDDDQGSKKQSN